MYKSHKVKVFIFAGRQETMSILMPQLIDHIIDEIIIAKNTLNKSDLQYLSNLKYSYDKITYIELPAHVIKDRNRSWKYLYQFMTDEDTIYFKLDDDIVYIEPGYFEKTCKFKVEHPEYLCVFPMVINNPFCNTLRKDSPFGNSSRSMWERLYAGFYSSEIGELIHREFLLHPFDSSFHVSNTIIGPECVYFSNKNHAHLISNGINWWNAERITINAICFLGLDFKKLCVPEKIQTCYSDELWLTFNVFDFTSQRHCIYGDTLVSHFAFSGQGKLLNNNVILDKYRTLVEQLYHVYC
jgi:hypothetical protein